jgi:hypothetical protein
MEPLLCISEVGIRETEDKIIFLPGYKEVLCDDIPYF